MIRLNLSEVYFINCGNPHQQAINDVLYKIFIENWQYINIIDTACMINHVIVNLRKFTANITDYQNKVH